MGREEPAENISGGFGEPMEHQSPDVGSRAEAVVERLGELYWRKTYGDRDAFACFVRTILSQNTSDVASQPAFDALFDRCGDGTLLAGIHSIERSALVELIRPAGLYNQKAEVLQDAAERILAEYGDAETFDRFVSTEPYADVRDVLLSFDGVGPKTADCVLLFAGGRPGVFPVDTHVHRIYRRLGIAPPDADHEAVREVLEGRAAESGGVPPEHCGFGHTASIQFGRDYCTATAPHCLEDASTCPLSDICDQVGVDPETGSVVDPADTMPE